MADISRFVLLIGVAVSLVACSDEQVPPSQSRIPPPSPAIIRKVQIALRNRGYYKGAANGFLGQDTGVSIQKFQLDHDQSVTPMVDNALLVSLGIRSH